MSIQNVIKAEIVDGKVILTKSDNSIEEVIIHSGYASEMSPFAIVDNKINKVKDYYFVNNRYAYLCRFGDRAGTVITNEELLLLEPLFLRVPKTKEEFIEFSEIFPPIVIFLGNLLNGIGDGDSSFGYESQIDSVLDRIGTYTVNEILKIIDRAFSYPNNICIVRVSVLEDYSSSLEDRSFKNFGDISGLLGYNYGMIYLVDLGYDGKLLFLGSCESWHDSADSSLQNQQLRYIQDFTL